MDIMELTRQHLTQRHLTDQLIQYSIEEVVKESAEHPSGDPEVDAYWAEVFPFYLRTFYPQAVETIYEHAESEIEKMFLNALVYHFLRSDPLRLAVTAPSPDAPAAIREYQNLSALMGKVADVAQRVEGPGSRGLDDYLGQLVHDGVIPAEARQQMKDQYIGLHGFGLHDAFHVTPQAGFPELILDGRTTRADLVVWIPSRPDYLLVVECDSYQYHGDKDTFTRDRQRDRLFRSKGYDVFRFSGPEIWRNPSQAALELYDHLHVIHQPDDTD